MYAAQRLRLQREVEAIAPETSRFVPGHPLAGREVSGPAAARADLFADRVWALTPGAGTDPDRTAQVTALVESLGAVVVTTTPEEHDRAVALTSHAPQVVSSLVAAGLEPLGATAVRLSGQGLRDMTRLASSDPELWTEILTSNAEPVSDALDGLIERLVRVRDGLLARGAGTAEPCAKRSSPGSRARPGSPASTGRSRCPTPWSPWSSPTVPGSWAGCSPPPPEPGSTSRTSASTMPRAVRPGWSSSRSARRAPAVAGRGAARGRLRGPRLTRSAGRRVRRR